MDYNADRKIDHGSREAAGKQIPGDYEREEESVAQWTPKSLLCPEE